MGLRKSQANVPWRSGFTALFRIIEVTAAITTVFAFFGVHVPVDQNNPPVAAQKSISPASTGAASTTSASSTTTPPACKKKMRITRPLDQAKVSGPDGVLVRGEACDLNGEHGWLFDYDPEDQYYYGTNPGPIVQRNGKWSYHDEPIGDPGDNNKVYTLTLVKASKTCNYKLGRIKRDRDGNVKVKAFPSSCEIVDERDILVSHPG